MTRILLVDDSKFLRLATEQALAQAGNVVCSASDSEHALEVARPEHPDLMPSTCCAQEDGARCTESAQGRSEDGGYRDCCTHRTLEKSAARLQHDRAFAFLEKSELSLDKGCAALPSSLAEIVRKLGLEVPHELTTK